MVFEPVTSAAWQSFVMHRAKDLRNPLLANILAAFELIPGGPQDASTDAHIHHGTLNADGPLALPSWITVIDGDLRVNGSLSTHIEGGDGHVTLVVFGDLYCDSIDHDWASILFVTGNVRVKDWVFAAREDSAFVVGGDFITPIFIGADIWVSVGGEIDMEYGYGYAVELSAQDNAYGARQWHPRRGWRELSLKLGLGLGRSHDEADFIDALEKRLAVTGNLFQPATGAF